MTKVVVIFHEILLELNSRRLEFKNSNIHTVLYLHESVWNWSTFISHHIQRDATTTRLMILKREERSKVELIPIFRMTHAEQHVQSADKKKKQKDKL
jgi:hypothetical protein